MCRAADGPLEKRTALLFPVHHEDPARIAGTIGAIAEELEALGKNTAFDVFVLSDTRGAEEGEAEEAAYADVRRALAGQIAVYYRRRIENTARKSGNLKDWVERFGGAYEHFVILDGDSIMSGASLVRLARAMEKDPKAGLIQTVPRLTGGVTLLQRLMQFASNIYGPPVAAGLAFWHRDQGNYWGHNAIIRTAAFASSAGLPELAGTPAVRRSYPEPRLRRGRAPRARRLGCPHGARRSRAPSRARRRGFPISSSATGAGRKATCSTSPSCLRPA